MKTMHTFVLAAVLGSCACAPDVQKTALRKVERSKPTAAAVETSKAAVPQVPLGAHAKAHASKPKGVAKVSDEVKTLGHSAVTSKPKEPVKVSKEVVGTHKHPSVTSKATASSKVDLPTPKAAIPNTTAKIKDTAHTVKKQLDTLKKVPKPEATVAPKPSVAVKSTTHAKPAETTKAVATPKKVTDMKATATPKKKTEAPAKEATTKTEFASHKAGNKAQPAEASKASITPKSASGTKAHLVPGGAAAVKEGSMQQTVHVVSKDAATLPIVHAHVQVKQPAAAPAAAASPAAAPEGIEAAGAPGAADWRKEYKHADDPDQLKWKWTTNKPGSYGIDAKAPPKLLPIGEGAYQSAEAVAQRTKDSMKDCEDGKWNDCFLKHGGDLTDGHTYGNLQGKYASPPKGQKSGAAVTDLGLLALSLLFSSLVL